MKQRYWHGLNRKADHLSVYLCVDKNMSVWIADILENYKIETIAINVPLKITKIV